MRLCPAVHLYNYAAVYCFGVMCNCVAVYSFVAAYSCVVVSSCSAVYGCVALCRFWDICSCDAVQLCEQCAVFSFYCEELWCCAQLCFYVPLFALYFVLLFTVFLLCTSISAVVYNCANVYSCAAGSNCAAMYSYDVSTVPDHDGGRRK